MTQETTPASDPRLDEWEKLANAEDVTKVRPTFDLGVVAREAIPALIAMVREKDTRADAWKDQALEWEARATAAEARVRELEAALREIGNPLTVWRERAEADGRQLSGLAYQIAENAQTLKDIAIAALTRADS
jgi:hypothetical protein